MYIRILAFLLVFQSFIACQQVQENAPKMEAKLASQSISNNWLESEKAWRPATDIIFQSTDGGQSWQDVSTGLPGDLAVGSFLVQNGEVYLGSEKGLYRSQISSTDPIWVKDLLLNEQITGVFQGQAGPYAYSHGKGFFQNISKDIWVPVSADLVSQHFRTIMETLDGTLFIGTDDGIFKSSNHGKTWKHVYDKGWMIHMVESDGVLICTNQYGILRSTDGGEHWVLVVSEGGVGIAVEVIEGGFAAITYNTESRTRRVRISEDSGKTWQPIDAGLPPQASIASIKQLGEYFFCGHPEGIFRSSDRGKTWSLILPSIGKKVFNLSVSGKVIYAVPRDGGC